MKTPAEEPLKTASKPKDGASAPKMKTPANAAVKSKSAAPRPEKLPYMQNRELSWLEFNKRVLDQSIDPRVPLLERLKFVAIWCSNLEEFFMVRVGSLLDLELAKTVIYDSKTCLTPGEQLAAVYSRVRELTPVASECFRTVRHALENEGVHQLYPDELTPKQRKQLADYMEANVLPLTSPQIVNALHPFPHLENGALYIAVRLDDQAEPVKQPKNKEARRAARAKAAENVVMGIVPLPRNCSRIIPLESDEGFAFILLEHALEMMAPRIFNMYPVKHANVIRVTRNADLDAHEESDEYDEDFRSHMKRILKKRARLGAVKLESERPLSDTTEQFLAKRLNLKRSQVFAVGLPLDMGYAFALPGAVPATAAELLTYQPAAPQWPASLMRGKSIIEQVQERDVLLSYPYETMDAFVHLLQEAAADPDVVSIKITLYRLASESRLAEALITAAENGKEVTALFELRARFDENNNIEWSQRFERAGCNIIYGFRDFKVHSKICVITRQTDNGLQFITQLGTGNYNEKTAKLYTDLSMITCDQAIGRDGAEFFRNMQLEVVSNNYQEIWVAPMMLKANLCAAIDTQIALAQAMGCNSSAGSDAASAANPPRIIVKTNSVTDKDLMVKLAEASRAGVKTDMLVRGISCLLPGIEGETDNIRVVSVVGRLLEHSRIYCFGAPASIGGFSDEIEGRCAFDPETGALRGSKPRAPKVSDDELACCTILLSSADLMTRNLDKRVEIAWPVKDPALKRAVLEYLHLMHDELACCTILLSSADLMTRNLDKRVEIAWPVKDPALKRAVLEYLHLMLRDTAKLRELKPDGTYTELGEFIPRNEDGTYALRAYDAQNDLVRRAYIAAERAPKKPLATYAMHASISTQIEAMEEEALEEEREQRAAAEPEPAAAPQPESQPAPGPEPAPASERHPGRNLRPHPNRSPHPSRRPNQCLKPNQCRKPNRRRNVRAFSQGSSIEAKAIDKRTERTATAVLSVFAYRQIETTSLAIRPSPQKPSPSDAIDPSFDEAQHARFPTLGPHFQAERTATAVLSVFAYRQIETTSLAIRPSPQKPSPSDAIDPSFDEAQHARFPTLGPHFQDPRRISRSARQAGDAPSRQHGHPIP